MDDLLDDLNPPQREAVLHQAGPMLVLAGAGSGKTRVITRRIASLVRDRQVPAWRVLAVTFTNKAAREMRERIEHLLGPQAQGLTVSTFHSASALILRREAEQVGLERNFVIYDDGDQMQLVRRAIREAGIEVSSVTPREILSRIDAEKNQGRLPEQMQPGDDPRQQAVQRVYRKYQALLRAANAVDFGDLLLLLVELLKHNENVRQYYQRRFSHVLVDEFQDTNPVQYQLLKLLAPPGPRPPNLVVVGDDDQSIYRWRGADVDNILGFPKEYPGCTVVKLEQNYRSDQIILEAAHAVISRNPRRMAKKLWSERVRGEHLGLIIARDERGEAQEVAAKIHALHRDGLVDYEQMAVFFRTNAQSRVIEETFRLMRVPYVLVSGRSFYDRAEVKDAASYLRLMANPRSDADLERIINVPARGIGDTTVERLREYAAQQSCSLFEAIEVPERIASLGSAAQKRLKAFRGLVERLVHFAQQSPDATSAARYMLEQTALVSTYMAEGSDEALSRAENLKELLTATQEFDRQREARLAAAGLPIPSLVPIPSGPEAPGTSDPELEFEPSAQGDLFAALAPRPAAPVPIAAPALDRVLPTASLADETGAALELEVPALQGFLEQLSLVGDADGQTGVGQQRVSLMTLHAAKGLEFDAVFITGMEDEIFPSHRALRAEAGEEEMSEERRLCYVGFTRARRRLFCSLAQSRALYGELRMNAPSRFLAEVPQALFGLHHLPEADEPRARAPHVRRRSGSEGVHVDRSFDQGTDFHQGSSDGEVKGMRVSHSQFGPGRVIEVSGQGPNAKLTIHFDNYGVKTVIARFLEPR